MQWLDCLSQLLSIVTMATRSRDTLLDRRTGRVHGVVNPVLALLHLDLGGTADPDHRHAARELRKPLLQPLLVVVRGGFLDLRLDLTDAALDVLLLAGAIDDRGVLLLDADPLGLASMSRVTFSSTDATQDHLHQLPESPTQRSAGK